VSKIALTAQPDIDPASDKFYIVDAIDPRVRLEAFSLLLKEMRRLPQQPV
jgi:hypothetical protein